VEAVRPRSFDYDEASRLRQEGMTLTDLALHFGVSLHAVKYATDPDFRERANEESRRRAKEGRATCLGGCGRLVYPHFPSRPQWTGYCNTCYAARSTDTVRTKTLRCTRCDRWKPDESFPHRSSNIARRGRAVHCRPCQTLARQDYRERHKIPCDQCGKPRLPHREKGNRVQDSGLCKTCYIASISR
jgi:hypothetical protein